MRSFSVLFGAVTAISAILGVTASPVSSRDVCDTELCGSNFTPVESRTVFTPVKRVTNAERLKRGLPLAPPTRRFTARHADPSTTPPPPTSARRGHIQVTSKDGQVLGYLSKTSFSQAQYRYQPDIADAATVSIDLPIGTTSGSTLDITLEDDDIPGFSLLSLVQGRESTDPNFSSGSFNYGYLASSAATAANATPADVANSYTTATSLTRSAESAVWSVNFDTGAIAPQWINSDGSKPTTTVFVQSTALYVGADSAAFNGRFPSPVTEVTLSFVPI